MKLSTPSAAEQRFLLIPKGSNLFSFLCNLIWSELNYIAISLCNKDPDFTFFLNRLVIYSLPTVMSFVTGNHTMDMFYLLKENFPIGLFNHEKEFREFVLFIKLFVVTTWRFWTKRSNILRSIESGLASTKVSGISQYILWSGSLWHPLNSSMLKNKWIFSLVISEHVCFLSMTVQLGVAKNHS